MIDVSCSIRDVVQMHYSSKQDLYRSWLGVVSIVTVVAGRMTEEASPQPWSKQVEVVVDPLTGQKAVSKPNLVLPHLTMYKWIEDRCIE